jgi:hypothetical protein
LSEIANFMDLQSSDVKEPEVLAPGEYLFMLRSYKPGTYNNDKQTPYVRVSLKVVEAINPSKEQDISNIKLVDEDFAMTDAARPIAKRFLTKTLGIDDNDGSKTFREMFEESLGVQVRGFVSNKLVGKNKDILIAVIDKFAPAN